MPLALTHSDNGKATRCDRNGRWHGGEELHPAIDVAHTAVHFRATRRDQLWAARNEHSPPRPCASRMGSSPLPSRQRAAAVDGRKNKRPYRGPDGCGELLPCRGVMREGCQERPDGDAARRNGNGRQSER